ncbi:unnamed protein product [Microthlaspi erraticum]|uniref:F-box domain-containing protein n=1 Tax=Microthlaspi erraticum TaxID=1685480 RepID=A0A6D2L5A8_9BRAS|nr:unnamed protein product [Microthlaspi erraticum]
MAPPSLVDICLESLIAHVEHLSDLNNIPPDLLKKIIPCLGAQELARLEEATADLSEYSNDRWIQLYESTFGEEDFNHARQELINYGEQFSWGSLFRARSSLLKTKVTAHEDLVESLSASYEEGESSRRKRSAKMVSNMYSRSERVEEIPRVLNKLSPCYNKKQIPKTIHWGRPWPSPSKVRSVEVAVHRITETAVSRSLPDDETEK